jgi:site-specific DNA-methyltransferase (adenine-specific)/site-specific DNA-methyltransferase (cytosine-N4-specific)
MSEPRRWKVSIVGHGEVDPRTVVAHPLNPKVHTAEQDAVVEASLRELGWVKSVLINEVTGHLLDGHERLELAILRGEATVPVEYVRLAEADEGKALLLLDPSGQLARTHVQRWAALQREVRTDEAVLRAFFAQQAAQHDPAAGEGEPELSPPAGPEAGEDGPAVGARGAALQAAWGTALGQLWACGPHYLWCGDSTQAEGWTLLRERVGQVRGCITSPPYAEQRAAAYGGVPAEGYVAWFRPLAGQVWEALAPDGSFFLNLKEHSDGIVRPVYVHELVVTLVREQGWRYLDEFCWQRVGVPGDPVERGKFKNMWEPVFWLAKQVRPVFHPERVVHRSAKAIIDTNYQPGLGTMQGMGAWGKRGFLGPEERRGDGWAYPGNRLTFGEGEAVGQPAAFPVGLPQWFVEVYSEVGDWWVDPFMGSGSTLMACHRTGRKCWGQERDPGYVAITLERYSQATGERPQRVA